MVRTYVRKTQRGLQYSKEDMANAIADIKHNKMSFHQAHLVYNIPRATLFTHLHGRRGKKSTTGGRSFAIPFEEETKLAEGLRCLEKWGFHVSKKEVQEIVSSFIIKNRISTPFKNNIPGQEWLRGFKARHQLSIKKAQSVEYTRKEICDPFLIYGFFHVLKETLAELDLNEKPGQIWILDETNVTLEPYETKVFDANGMPCIAENKNITVLSAASASGEKVAPIIIFKEKYVWDCWIAEEDNCYSFSTSRLSPYGESRAFLEFLETSFLEAIGDVRPTLLIYDGHKTHINYDVIEFAKTNRITILKFPPYSTHLLRPLFKPFYEEVNAGIAAWQQRQFEISKLTFTEIVESIWNKIRIDFFQMWFREAGIYPYNGEVVPRDKFDQNSLKRWDEELKIRLARAENAIQLLNDDKHNLMEIMEQINEPENNSQYNYVEVSSEFLIKEEDDSDTNRDPLAYLQKPTINQTSVGSAANTNLQGSSDDSNDASSSMYERLNCELNNTGDSKHCLAVTPSNHQRSSLSIRQYGKLGEYNRDAYLQKPAIKQTSVGSTANTNLKGSSDDSNDASSSMYEHLNCESNNTDYSKSCLAVNSVTQSNHQRSGFSIRQYGKLTEYNREAYLQKPAIKQTSVRSAANTNLQGSSDDSNDASSSMYERLNCESNNADDSKHGLADTSMTPSNHQRSVRQYGKFGEYIADELSNLPPHLSVVCQKLMSDVLFEAKCGNVDKYSQMVIKRKKKK